MIPLWVKAVGVLALLAALWAGVQWFKRDQQAVGAALERAVWVERELERAKAEADLQEQLFTQKEESDRATKEAVDRANADRDRAAAVARELRERLATIAAAPRDPAAQPERASAGDAIGVLADVLRRADQRAGKLAAYADSARIAGQQCERDYDALRTPGGRR